MTTDDVKPGEAYLRELELDLMEHRDFDYPVNDADLGAWLVLLRNAMRALGVTTNG